MNRFAMSLVTGFAAFAGMNVENANAGDFRFGLDIHIGDYGRGRVIDPGFCRPAPRPVVVCPTPVVVCPPAPVLERVWVADVFEDRCREVWVPEVVDFRCREVLIPAVTRTERFTVRDHCGRLVTEYRTVVVVPARCETVRERVIVAPVHMETVRERVLVCAGHWETRRCG